MEVSFSTMNDDQKQWVINLDDDDDDRFLFQRAFQAHSANYLLQSFGNAEDLFQLLDESLTLPALLVLDLNMPLIDGFGVLKRLRMHPTFCHIPIVLLTTSDTETDRERAYQLGANDFLTKPHTLDQLTRLVNRLV
ncbi:response regulator [Spirosoma gilvum]